jgi:hypothetical protein
MKKKLFSRVKYEYLKGDNLIICIENFFISAQSQLLTPEMDSRAKTKYKIIMQYCIFEKKFFFNDLFNYIPAKLGCSY